MNVSEHLKVFTQEMIRRNYAKNTVYNYGDCIKVFFEKVNKDHPKNVNEQDIKSFLASYSTVNTQRNYHSAIKLFYEICLKQKNKFKHIPYARKDRKQPIVLSQEEVQKLFNVCENKKHRVIMALLYSAGLRVSEVINLKWQHIDRSRMVINILAAKGNKDRQVMLEPSLIPLLESYWKEYRSKTYVLNGQFPEIELRYSDRSVLNIVKQLAKKAGIEKRAYTHLLRHCAFTHMVENGTDINLIQRIAGHSSVKTTALYTQISHNITSKIKSPLSTIKL